MKIKPIIFSLLTLLNITCGFHATAASHDQIDQLIVQLNNDFERYENTNPQQGYCVTIQTTPTLQAKLTPHGGIRSTKLLSGIPTNEYDYVQKCPFCQYSQKNYTDKQIVKTFNDGTYAVTSMSNQVLVIPEKHYPHIFNAPFEQQRIILKNIMQIRDDHQDNIYGPIEFHCGSAAGQTVFHIHGRTGVYIKN